jgi:hypothetical protein
VEKYCRTGQAADDNIIRRMRILSYITKAKNTHSQCAKMVASTRLNITLYVHCLPCYCEKHISNVIKATVRKFKVSVDKDNLNETHENETFILKPCFIMNCCNCI